MLAFGINLFSFPPASPLNFGFPVAQQPDLLHSNTRRYINIDMLQVKKLRLIAMKYTLILKSTIFRVERDLGKILAMPHTSVGQNT